MEFFFGWRKEKQKRLEQERLELRLKKEKEIEEKINSKLNIKNGKIFYGHYYQKMSQLLGEGFRPFTIKDIMIYRLNSLGKPEEEKFWLNNTIASADVFYTSNNGYSLLIDPPDFKAKIFKGENTESLDMEKASNRSTLRKLRYSGLTPRLLEEMVEKRKTDNVVSEQLVLCQNDENLLKNFINVFYIGQESMDILLHHNKSNARPLLFWNKPSFTIFDLYDNLVEEELFLVAVKPREVVSLDNNIRERIVYEDRIIYNEKIIEREKPVPVVPYTMENIVKCHRLLEKICKEAIESSEVDEMSSFLEHLGKQINPNYNAPVLQGIIDYSTVNKNLQEEFERYKKEVEAIKKEIVPKRTMEDDHPALEKADGITKYLEKKIKDINEGKIKGTGESSEKFSKIELE